MKLKIYTTIFVILVLTVIVVIGLIVIKYSKSYMNEQKAKNVIEVFSTSSAIIENGEVIQEKNVMMDGYKVIGIVRIPKIDIEYPILDIETYNPEETAEPMKISIVKYWGGNVNDYGNLSIAGHNKYDGTMFGKTRKLDIGDIVELTDLKDNTIEYQIYDKFVTDPNDVTILKTKDDTLREVTLITCTNGNKNRLILKAREILD